MRSRLEVRLLAGRRDVRGRHRHLLRPAAGQRAAGDGRAGRRASSGRRWGRSPRAWARCSTTSSPAQGNDVTELRTIHDWVIKPKMRTVPGVAEINSWGGYEKQYQVRIDPEPAHQVRPDVRRGRARPSRRTTATSAAATSARARGRCWCRAWAARPTSSRSRRIVITAKDGVPIRVGDVADVAIGSRDPPRRGDGRRQGRSRAGPRLHADGREHATRSPGR